MNTFNKFLIVGLSSLALVACGKVSAGYVGVKVHNMGTDSGVVSEEVGVGYEWLGMGTDMYTFPTFEQNYVWTAGVAEGSRNDESFTFQDVDGLPLGADIGISYQIVPAMASDLFETYRMGIGEITDQRIRNMVRGALNDAASTRTAEQIYGEGRVEIMQIVLTEIQTHLEPQGIIVNDLYWIGAIRLPEQVQQSIELKVQADQEADRRENMIATAEAQAQIEIAEADGRAQVRLLAANAAAEARILEATAEAEALTIQGAALRSNPDILQLSAIEKWDGTLPRVMAGEDGVIPFLNVGPE